MVTLFTTVLFIIRRVLGGGGLGDERDQVERFLDILCCAGTVGLETAQGGFGVLAGIGEATGLRQRTSDVTAGLRAAVHIACCVIQSDSLAVVGQSLVEGGGF